jgi:hypothetical protein
MSHFITVCVSVFRWRVQGIQSLFPTGDRVGKRFNGILSAVILLPLVLCGCEPTVNTVKQTSDQAELADIATHARNWQVRVAAIEKLTGQDVLEQIALKAERSEVRVAAINRITNQAILGKVAADTEDYTIVNAAFDKITDQTILEKLVNSHELRKGMEYYVRSSALERINDQDVLERLARTDGEYQNKVIQKITNETLLTDIFLSKSVNGGEIIDNITKRVNNEAQLERIAMGAKSTFTRWEAIKKIKNQEILANIVIHTKEPQNYTMFNEVNHVVDLITDQKLLARVAMEAEDEEERSLAARMIDDPAVLQQVGMWLRPDLTRQVTDQALLARIAAEAKESKVRDAALELLSDQNALAKITVKDEERELRRLAFSRLTDAALRSQVGVWVDENLTAQLTDQTLLNRIAVEAKDVAVRATAAGKLTDQAQLEKFALTAPDENVRASALSNLANQTVLGKIATEDKSDEVRLTATQKLTDQALLGKIAAEDIDDAVRASAAKKLTDPAVLEKIGMWVHPELTSKVTDQTLLKTIVQKSPDMQVRLAAVDTLTDQKALGELSREFMNPSREGFRNSDIVGIRVAVVGKLTDQTILQQIALQDLLDELRPIAIARITDQNFLSKIARSEKEDNDIRVAAVSALTDQGRLEEIASVQKISMNVRVAAVAKLNDSPRLREWAAKAPEAAIRQAAVMRISDDAFLSARFREEPSASVREAMISTLRGKEALRAIASTAYHQADRAGALKRLQTQLGDPAPDLVAAEKELERQEAALRVEPDVNKLQELALNGFFDVLRTAAVKYLKDPAVLERVGQLSTSRDVLIIVLDKIGDNAALARLGATASDPAMKLAAAQKSGATTWEQIFTAATARASATQSLGDALAAVALFADVQEDAKAGVQEAALNLIRRGDESRIPEMVDLLDGYGDETLAEDYLNCGQPDLDRAARSWASAHGYSVGQGNGSHRATWGQ